MKKFNRKAEINGKKTNACFIEGEMWKEIEAFPQYYISNYGRCYSFKKYVLLTPKDNGTDYLQYCLYTKSDDGKLLQVLLYAHQLVATAFIPNPENKPIVHHIDRNKQNNHADNLQRVTKEEHKELHRTKPRKKVKSVE